MRTVSFHVSNLVTVETGTSSTLGTVALLMTDLATAKASSIITTTTAASIATGTRPMMTAPVVGLEAIIVSTAAGEIVAAAPAITEAAATLLSHVIDLISPRANFIAGKTILGGRGILFSLSSLFSQTMLLGILVGIPVLGEDDAFTDLTLGVGGLDLLGAGVGGVVTVIRHVDNDLILLEIRRRPWYLAVAASLFS